MDLANLLGKARNWFFPAPFLQLPVLMQITSPVPLLLTFLALLVTTHEAEKGIISEWPKEHNRVEAVRQIEHRKRDMYQRISQVAIVQISQGPK